MGGATRRFEYVPALDGARALAVVAVLAFHADLAGARGGFLGVSVFFTLSGYLITSLLVGEHASTGTLSLKAFYTRRARRLLPAAYLCIALVLALGFAWGAVQREHLPGDVFASVMSVANWRFILEGNSYRDLFIGQPSPLAHFWSLAIEEQCYLVLPLVVLWSLRRGRRTLAVVLSAAFLASVASAFLAHDPDLVYQGTHTRAAELLAGALLALALPRWQGRERLRGAIGFVGLGGFVVAVTTVTLADRWLYRGGLAALSLLWVALLVGLTGANPLSRVLAVRPLVRIGQVSYGIYLFHWPIFLVLTPERLGFGGPALLAIRLAATALATWGSYVLLERPVRMGRRLRGGWAKFAAPLTAGVLVAAALTVVPAPNYTATEELLAMGDQSVVDFSARPLAADDPATTTPPPPPPAKVLVLGPSPVPVALLQMQGWDVRDGTQFACPAGVGVELRMQDETLEDTTRCEPTLERWGRLLLEVEPDVIVVGSDEHDRGLVRYAGDTELPSMHDTSNAKDVAARFQVTESLVDQAVGTLIDSGVPIVLFDAAPTVNSAERLQRVALRRGASGVVTSDQRALVEAVAAEVDAAGVGAPEPAVPMLVLGDSTSLDVASALHAGSDGRLAVLWAGANGCPFAPVEATRASHRDGWAPSSCPSLDTTLPPLLAEHPPKAVVLVVGPTELQEHRYAGDPKAHVAGDPAFTAAHDAAMADLLRLVGPDVPVIVADCPPIRAGGWASREMADPRRVADWNAQVARWDASSDQVVGWHYGEDLADFEWRHGGDIRSDGVHPDVQPLTELAREHFVAELLALIGID